MIKYWPQIAYIALLVASGFISLVKHGERQDPYNFWDWAWAASITVFLLTMGGFFG